MATESASYTETKFRWYLHLILGTKASAVTLAAICALQSDVVMCRRPRAVVNMNGITNCAVQWPEYKLPSARSHLLAMLRTMSCAIIIGLLLNPCIADAYAA